MPLWLEVGKLPEDVYGRMVFLLLLKFEDPDRLMFHVEDLVSIRLAARQNQIPVHVLNHVPSALV